MLLIALTVGFGLSWYALTDGRIFGAVEIGPWSAWRNVGGSGSSSCGSAAAGAARSAAACLEMYGDVQKCIAMSRNV